MSFTAFIERVRADGRLPDPEQTITVIRATLHTLGERLPSRVALRLSSELPHELATYLLSPPGPAGEVFSYDEFVARVATRAKLPRERAAQKARVVMLAFMSVLSPHTRELFDKGLPRDLHALVSQDGPVSHF